MSAAQWAELEPLLVVADYRKGDPLVRQGDEEMEQFFILDGMLKRVVSNPEGREMILRFAAETEMDTSYAAWRLRTPVPYSIVAVTKVRTAELPMPLWVEFLDRHPEVKLRFEYEVMKLMSEVMAHSITLHLLDAPGRLSRFQRKHPELAGAHPEEGTRRLPQPHAGNAEPAAQEAGLARRHRARYPSISGTPLPIKTMPSRRRNATSLRLVWMRLPSTTPIHINGREIAMAINASRS